MSTKFNCSVFYRYHGEKLFTFHKAAKKPKYMISTIYDEPREEDSGDALLRRMPSTSMKYYNKRMNIL